MLRSYRWAHRHLPTFQRRRCGCKRIGRRRLKPGMALEEMRGMGWGVASWSWSWSWSLSKGVTREYMHWRKRELQERRYTFCVGDQFR